MQPGSPLRLMEPLKEEGTDIWQGDEALDESWVYIPSHSTAVQIPSLSPIHFNHYPEESEQLNKVSILWQNVGLSITFSHYLRCELGNYLTSLAPNLFLCAKGIIIISV